MNLILTAKKLPDKPGVYIFKDKKNNVLYVGRTVSLKRRVLSYFQKNLDSRIEEMVSRAEKINHIQTDTLLDAIILEANLIKKYWPKYNVKDRDNRSFVYLLFPKTDFPEPIIVRQRELEKYPNSANIFGPYQSFALLGSALKIIRRIFPYSTCKPFSGKPCFDYQIGQCPGLCIGKVTKDEYQKNIKNIILLLSGEKKRVIQNLKKENPQALKSLKHIQDVSLITKETIVSAFGEGRIEGYDISHLTGKETYGSMIVFKNGKPSNKDYRLFKVKDAPANDDLRSLEEVLKRRLKHKEWPYPDLILIDGGKPQIDFVAKVFSKNHINIPFVGISKFSNDKLVFPAKTKKTIKELAESIKKILLSVRDEAHRFSLKASRKKRRIK